jgi:hypothetical protein
MNRRDFCNLGIISTIGLVLPTRSLADNNIYLSNDIYLDEMDIETFTLVRNRINRVKYIVGYANFNILSFDDMIKIAKSYSKVGKFSQKELSFIEKIFYEKPYYHGFYGSRVVDNITFEIPKNDITKIPHTGHFLYKGKPLLDYKRLKKDIGSSIVLTSGVRSVVKQMNLYFNKIHSCNGNISLASKSLAPPAYSYHSISDFDVGKKGWGYKNFTPEFARTKEFQKIKTLDYIQMRYTINNTDGVRYEPWHVKII